MLRKLIFSFNNFLLFLKKNRQVNIKIYPLKVNVGSGFNVVSGWVNIDGNINLIFRKLPKFVLSFIYDKTNVKSWYDKEHFINVLKQNIFIHHNVKYGLPFKTESVDFVYSSHLLEHLYKDEGLFLIKEIYRILKKGGILRLVVPDLKYVISLFVSGQTNLALSYFFPESRADEFSRHRYMYDFEILSKILKDVGFKDIQEREYRVGLIEDVSLLDNRPQDSLHIEAIK